MPFKYPKQHKDYQKKYQTSWYQRNKKLHAERCKQRRKVRRAEWAAFKATLSCSICGFSHPAAIDFHHTDPSKKEREVNYFSKNNSLEKARSEIEKCVTLCSNCHRILHHEEREAARAVNDENGN